VNRGFRFAILVGGHPVSTRPYWNARGAADRDSGVCDSSKALVSGSKNLPLREIAEATMSASALPGKL
jgi:hypothetical protein